ncbi:hypothetical protein GE09DRAFT_1163626 [Coniochaeta sp. 2T2.1]|nr:hypothetical protein GE09DRAFT_1163626 [Coniochaeta sp. 2T2.1]
MIAVSRLGHLHARLAPRMLQPVSGSAGVFGFSHGRQQFRARSCKSNQQQQPPSVTSPGFWGATQTWKRAGVNTSRCLVGCTLGDFSAMWYLQAFHPEIGMEIIMAISMTSGLTTSLLLETVLLKFGRDRLPWMAAARTAAGMSMISMITMELAENVVDFHLTGGVVQLESPTFWIAAVVSMAAGFLAPLPYNYVRLRKFSRSCH